MKSQWDEEDVWASAVFQALLSPSVPLDYAVTDSSGRPSFTVRKKSRLSTTPRCFLFKRWKLSEETTLSSIISVLEEDSKRPASLFRLCRPPVASCFKVSEGRLSSRKCVNSNSAVTMPDDTLPSWWEPAEDFKLTPYDTSFNVDRLECLSDLFLSMQPLDIILWCSHGEGLMLVTWAVVSA